MKGAQKPHAIATLLELWRSYRDEVAIAGTRVLEHKLLEKQWKAKLTALESRIEHIAECRLADCMYCILDEPTIATEPPE